MELRQLEYFVAVARHRHFTRAAADVSVAQPALSQQIRKLEAELGTDLFRRTTRRVELTDAGELLLPSDGLDGLASRTALWLLYPAVLWGTGFLSDEERRAAANNLSPAAIRAALRRLRESPPEEAVAAEPEQPGRGPRLTRETLEAEQRDEDARP